MSVDEARWIGTLATAATTVAREPVHRIAFDMEVPVHRLAAGLDALYAAGTGDDIEGESVVWFADTIAEDFDKLRDQIDKLYTLAGLSPLSRE